MTITELEPRKAVARPSDDEIDAVQIEIIKGALRSTQGEMEALLERTAMSPIIREKQDYFVGMFERTGRLLIGTKIPVLGKPHCWRLGNSKT